MGVPWAIVAGGILAGGSTIASLVGGKPKQPAMPNPIDFMTSGQKQANFEVGEAITGAGGLAQNANARLRQPRLTLDQARSQAQATPGNAAARGSRVAALRQRLMAGNRQVPSVMANPAVAQAGTQPLMKPQTQQPQAITSLRDYMAQKGTV